MTNDEFRPEPPNVDQFIADSLDGFQEAMEPIECRFFVVENAARWVKYNLPAGFNAIPVEGGIEVSGVTAGVRPPARLVVELGEDARAITVELAAIVRELAAGASRAHDATKVKLKLRSVRAKRSTKY